MRAILAPRTAGAALPAGDVAPPWHTMTTAGVLRELGADSERGLSAEEAARRLARHGPNAIADATRRGVLAMLRDQFTDATVIVLAIAALVSVLVGERVDAAAIVAILVLNAALGIFQDYRAERAIEALKELAAPLARARRDDAWVTLASGELVPGDVVALEAGNMIPADLRLVGAHRLSVDESLLTGESLPSEKITAAIEGDTTALGDRRNLAFKGTSVTSGRGHGVVIATGMRTELGRIAGLLAEQEDTRTPLQRRLARFGRQIVAAVLLLCAALFVVGLLRGEAPALMFMTALSLAVAAIPEALPAVVTLSLALGARKLVRQQALIRHLPAVETLGSVTCICADKTGTLTENRMRVETIVAGDALVALSPGGLADERWGAVYEAMSLVNDVITAPDGSLVGDPTEVALHRAATDALPTLRECKGRRPRIAELPFSAERGLMTTIHEDARGPLAYSKGAPERVVELCGNAIAEGGTAPLDRAAVLRAAERLAAAGLRVLAFATRRLATVPSQLAEVESGLTFLGLVGLFDAPRAEAAESIAQCRSAGIRVVMITGDHPATALAVATRLGIATTDAEVVTGTLLASMTDAQLDQRVLITAVYARVAPEHKLRIVSALQRAGELVAMTGDGVNDAPALRRADIGVAMGQKGTDVAREASDMVLLDDNFRTIVNAVREGRRVHDNIRRFVRYSLSTNGGEILTVVLAPFLGLPLPLIPVQILWMNLVTDGLPGLALSAEPAERDVMRRPPLSPGEGILSRGLTRHVVWVAVLMAALALGLEARAVSTRNAHWQSLTFTVLTLSQLAHVLAIRSERRSLWNLGLLSNRPLLGAVMLTGAMQLAVLYVPALRRIFQTQPLTPGELAGCIALALVVFVAVEVEKWNRRRAAAVDARAGDVAVA